MKKLKRIVACILATTTMAINVGGMSVSAANTGDTGFSFSVSWSDYGYGETLSRNKDNSSSVYIKSESSFDFKVQVMGSSGSSTWVNRTKHSYAIIPAGTQRAIYNYVNENGEDYAKLRIRTTKYPDGGWAEGLWSPDCAGTYTVANP